MFALLSAFNLIPAPSPAPPNIYAYSQSWESLLPKLLLAIEIEATPLDAAGGQGTALFPPHLYPRISLKLPKPACGAHTTPSVEEQTQPGKSEDPPPCALLAHGVPTSSDPALGRA